MNFNETMQRFFFDAYLSQTEMEAWFILDEIEEIDRSLSIITNASNYNYIMQSYIEFDIEDWKSLVDFLYFYISAYREYGNHEEHIQRGIPSFILEETEDILLEQDFHSNELREMFKKVCNLLNLYETDPLVI